MDKKMIAVDVAMRVSELLGIETGVIYQQKLGGLNTGITVGDRRKVAPVVYIDSMIEDGKTVDEIADEVAALAKNGYVEWEASDIVEMLDESRIVYRLISNDNFDFYKNMPMRSYMDMIIVYGYYISQNAFTYITNDLMRIKGLTEQQLYRHAMENTQQIIPATLESMSSIIGEMTDIETQDEQSMYVLSNKDRYFGAAAVLYPNLLQRIKNQLGSFYLLPSSVHEWIIIPASSKSSSELNQMINDVNREYVNSSNQLSNHCYLYIISASSQLIMC